MDNPNMDLTKNIAGNLSDWMANTPSLDTLKKVASRSGVGFGTVQRAKNGDGNPTITNLGDIARAFGKRVEDLIAPIASDELRYKSEATHRFATREKLHPDVLHAETVEHLSNMDIDDQNVWLATITAAANKARKAKQEKSDRLATTSPGDPPLEGRRTA